MTDWREVETSLRAYFDSVRTVRPRLGLTVTSLRASDSSFVRVVYAHIDGGPMPGWWSFVVAGNPERPWRIGLFYAVGEPEPLQLKLIPLRSPSNEELKPTALRSEAAGSLRSPAALFMVRRGLTPARYAARRVVSFPIFRCLFRCELA